MKKLSVSPFALLFLLILGGCGNDQANHSIPPSAEKPAETASGPTGRVRGVVQLQGNAPAAKFESISQDQNVCGDRVSVSRLALGKEKGIQNAFVFLDGVPSSEEIRPRQSLLIDQKNCEYVPHSLVVRTGNKIEITNSDPILHNVHGHELTDHGQQTLFNIAQPLQGQHTVVETTLTPGIVHLTCEAGHPWMSAYLFVANHPYVAATGENGEFVIDGVPPGTYHIKMWHEGVILKRNLQMLQRYEYEEPYEIALDVKVEAGGESFVKFDLVLRSSLTP